MLIKTIWKDKLDIGNWTELLNNIKLHHSYHLIQQPLISSEDRNAKCVTASGDNFFKEVTKLNKAIRLRPKSDGTLVLWEED